MTNRWLIVLALTAFVLSCTITAFCEDPSPSLGSRWHGLASTYGLQTTTEIPVGVSPLEIQSEKELAQILRTIERSPSNLVIIEGNGKQTDSLAAEREADLLISALYVTTIDVWSLHYDYLVDRVWRTRFNLWFDLYVAMSGSFHWIDDVRNVHVGLSGLHPFSSLEDTYTDSYIYPDLQKTRVTGGGSLEYFFILEGVFVYYTKPAWLTVVYPLH